MKKYNSVISIFAIIAMIAMNLGFVQKAEAVQLTLLQDTLSTVTKNVVANHTIQFVSTSGVIAGGTITVAFPAEFNMNSVTVADMDLAEGNTSCASFAEKPLAGAASGLTWKAELSTQSIIFTSGTGVITGGNCVQIEVGTNTTEGGSGTVQVINPTNAANDLKMTITAGVDSASLAISIINNGVVAVTATVNPTLAFYIGATNTIGFGTLTSANARYATAAWTGDTNDVIAHSMTVATNAATGYVLTYSGALLTNTNTPADTIDYMNNVASQAGIEQFGISVAVSNGSTNSSIVAGYANGSVWKFVVGGPTTIVSRGTPTVTETIAAHYLANISPITQPGSYSTAITYIATGIF